VGTAIRKRGFKEGMESLKERENAKDIDLRLMRHTEILIGGGRRYVLT
jgi:azurin